MMGRACISWYVISKKTHVDVYVLASHDREYGRKYKSCGYDVVCNVASEASVDIIAGLLLTCRHARCYSNYNV